MCTITWCLNPTDVLLLMHPLGIGRDDLARRRRHWNGHGAVHLHVPEAGRMEATALGTSLREAKSLDVIEVPELGVTLENL